MNQEILEAIRKSLPSIQVDLINQELGKAAKYDYLAGEYNKLKTVHEEVSKKLLEYQAKEKEMNDKIVEATKKMEEASNIRREFEIKSLKHELQCANVVKQDLKELMNAAFRNPTIHKSFSRQVPVQQGGWTNQVCESEIVSQD